MISKTCLCPVDHSPAHPVFGAGKLHWRLLPFSSHSLQIIVHCSTATMNYVSGNISMINKPPRRQLFLQSHILIVCWYTIEYLQSFKGRALLLDMKMNQRYYTKCFMAALWLPLNTVIRISSFSSPRLLSSPQALISGFNFFFQPFFLSFLANSSFVNFVLSFPLVLNSRFKLIIFYWTLQVFFSGLIWFKGHLKLFYLFKLV